MVAVNHGGLLIISYLPLQTTSKGDVDKYNMLLG